MSVLYGQPVNGGALKPIPLAADGLSVPVGGTITATVDTTGLATAAKQDSGNTSLASIKTDLDAIAASGAGSKPAGQATMANSAPVVIASDQAALPNKLSASTDPGQNLAVTTTDSAFASAAATCGVMVMSLLANTDKVYVGLAVTTALKGIELNPGDSIWLPVANANQVHAIAASGTQNVHSLAV